MDDIHQKPTIRTRESLLNKHKISNADPVNQVQVATDYLQRYPELQKPLESSEVIQWVGKPDRGSLNLLFLMSSAATAFVFAAFTLTRPMPPAIAGIANLLFAFVFVAYVVWHVNALKTTYCVTDRRVMWIKSHGLDQTVDSLPYEKIRQLSSGMSTVAMLAGPTQYHQRFLCGLGSETATVEKLIADNMRTGGELVSFRDGFRQVISTKSSARSQKNILALVCFLIVVQIIVAFFQFMNQTKPHYVLYRPSNLEANKKYPLIIGFDAVGNGQSEVDALRSAAEKDKAFVLGLNDGGVGTSFETWGETVDQSIKETLEKFPIDSNRIYVSGFAAGGMAAYSYVEHRGEHVRGVIINTALTPYEEEAPFDDKLPATYPKNLSVVMLASPTDKRYGSMKRARALLEKKAGWQVKWIEFPGGQIYAPSSDYVQAVDWLFTQE
ncbi:MAG TPA: hypothetical protein V6C86_10050 [Oculatellaceae cyanobacterium]